MNYNSQPIVLITGFKAGTWMMRKTLKLMTGMDFFEPDIIPGEKKYYDIRHLYFKKNSFYSWHNIPTEEVVLKLNKSNAKTIFVVRNIYDIILSIYNHFYKNIDEDIGRGNNKDKFLKQFTFDEGITLIISGFDEGNGIRWNGMHEIIDHYNYIFKAIKKCDSIILSYDDLILHKYRELEKINTFLNLQLNTTELKNIVQQTTFEHMKNEAEKEKRGVSHFQNGKAKQNRQQLKLYHQVHLRQIIKQTAPDIYENAKKSNMENIVQY